MALQAKIKKKFSGFTLDVEFETKEGCMGILGASGCGKSMTLKCIAGIEKPDSGRIVLNGRVLFDSEKKINLPVQKRNVGYLFQNYALFPTMTVEQNLMVVMGGKKEEKRTKIKEQLEHLTENKKMSEAEKECIRISDIRIFVKSELGQRMKTADLSGLLFREQPFVISRSAAEIDESWDENERVLVQGIIDAYFMENDEIVLVDYKTDYVRKGEEKKLV